MEFYDVVENRRSIKRYKDKIIEREKLYRILESSTLSPSWSCQHCWRLLIIDEAQLKNRIAECLVGTNPAREGLFQAPAAAVLCGDPVNGEEIDEREYYMCDCGIAMGHFMLAAANEGLATCWVGLFDEDKMKSILNIPEPIRIIAVTPLGYGDEFPGSRTEKSIKDITYYNKWDSEMVFK